MPNRMLRDWTASDKINSLSVHAERFFVRLIMKVDDFGCFHADHRLLKSFLFPLLVDGVREADISRWITECEKAGLIVLYEAETKRYLQILDFRQRLDRAKAKFPLPLKTKPLTSVNEIPPEVEVEVERKLKADPFFEMFRRAAGSHITDEELQQQANLFKNKYPNVHANQAGGLINAWVANIGKQPPKEKKMVL